MKLRVGTRRSPLALAQTGQAMDELRRRRPGLVVELVEVVTTGDRIQDRPLREAGGKGLFLKELDEALLDGRIDCAVHSLKDVPTDLCPGTVLAAVLERADPRDVLVTRNGAGLDALAEATVLGTTSLRRQAQAAAVVPGLQAKLLRGNVETRLRKLLASECDATFLAAAGLARLGLSLDPARGVALDPFRFVPAAGQGAVALTARGDDAATIEALSALEHAPTRLAVAAERSFARVFGGGCHLPLAAYAKVEPEAFALVGLVAAPDGSACVRREARLEGHAVGRLEAESASALGEALGREALDAGGRAIVDALETGA